MGNRWAAALVALGAAGIAGAAQARDKDAEPSATQGPAATQTGDKSVYVPLDFARYAPRNAYDMLDRVPGFSIREDDERRGLGSATGNVLFNGQRSSSKSDDLATQLSRIPAGNVERIEIVDGSGLDIPGLSGQVANVVFAADGLSGQFTWRGEWRAHFADPMWFWGNVALTGKAGNIEYEAGLDNTGAYRGAAGGYNDIRDGAGFALERQRHIVRNRYDAPKLSARLTWKGPAESIAHLSGHYELRRERNRTTVGRAFPDETQRYRKIVERDNGSAWGANADYEFALGPGRLKLVGLYKREDQPFVQTLLEGPQSDYWDTGRRFIQSGNTSETIARGEYAWAMLGGDWQAAAEGAFNRLSSVSSLGDYDPLTGAFDDVALGGGTGGVSEDRYEASLSHSRVIAPKLTLQLIAALEKSTISQTTPGGIRRTFTRPKGSAALAWAPSPDFDMSVKLERRVLQLDFYDFLAQAFLSDDNANSGNTDLRPRQDWSLTAEMNRRFGRWGAAKARLTLRDVEDLVELVPVGDGESVGNVAKAKAAAIDVNATLELEQLGWKGARLDVRTLFQTSRLRDPFTGGRRQWAGFTDRVIEVNLRDDLPGTDLAWGGFLYHEHQLPTYRRNERVRAWEGPLFAGLYIEHKNVAGLTVRADWRNIPGARNYRKRTVWQGERDASPILFTEDRDRKIGPIFRLAVSGTF